MRASTTTTRARPSGQSTRNAGRDVGGGLPMTQSRSSPRGSDDRTVRIAGPKPIAAMASGTRGDRRHGDDNRRAHRGVHRRHPRPPGSLGRTQTPRWHRWVYSSASKRNVSGLKHENWCRTSLEHRYLVTRGGRSESTTPATAVTAILGVDVTALDANGFEIPGGCRQANSTMPVDHVIERSIRRTPIKSPQTCPAGTDPQASDTRRDGRSLRQGVAIARYRPISTP